MTHDTRLCECGCGTPTRIFRSQPRRFAPGHWNDFQRNSLPYLANGGYTAQDRGYKTPCWVAPNRSIHSTGYVQVTVEGKGHRLHRVVWEAQNGPVPNGLELDHLCCVKECFRPDHLEAVPHMVNSRRGPQTKLSPEIVLGIRNDTRSQRQIARAYGLGKTTVARIQRGEAWSDV